MNSRIKELASQCWDQRLHGRHFDQEMFAELIVRECVAVAVEQKQWVEAQQPTFNYNDDKWDRARIQQSDRIIGKIREHFGVEE